MTKPPKKPAFELVSNGYLKIDGGRTELVHYGSIVCYALNEYFGRPEIPLWMKTNSVKIQKIHEMIQDIKVNSNTKWRTILEIKNPILKDLQRIVTDRDNYILKYEKNTALFNSKAIEVQSYWDSEHQRIVQRIYVNDIEELLLYDIGAVLERKIKILQCYCGRYFISSRGSRKYCSEHSKEGANKARYQNRKKDRCKSLYYKICNRLRVAPYCGFDDFNNEYNRLLALESARKLTEEEKFLALQELDQKYRQRKSRQ